MEKRMKKIPAMQKMLETENAKIMTSLEHSLKPYHDKFERISTMPSKGISRETILSDMQKMHDLESPTWQNGYVSGGIYHGDSEHIDFLNKIYGLAFTKQSLAFRFVSKCYKI
jgi:sphinganine-1-phosphate aldolase